MIDGNAGLLHRYADHGLPVNQYSVRYSTTPYPTTDITQTINRSIQCVHRADVCGRWYRTDFQLRFSISPGNLQFSLGMWRQMQGFSVEAPWVTFKNEEVI